jgi:acyl-coenzyme A thioesterase PaaI-like protein
MPDAAGPTEDAWHDAHLDTPRTPDIAAFASPARQTLAHATRHLMDAVLTAEDASDTDLVAAAAAVEAEVTRLTGTSIHDAPRGVRSRVEQAYADYLPRSPVTGEAHPAAPPLVPSWDPETGILTATGTLSAAYEGPPGFAHGGVLAMLFDEVIGMGNIAAGNPGMTASLTVRYLRPTPIHRPLDIRAWVDRAEGRRIHARGECIVDGIVTATAEGTFATVTPERAAEYFGERQAPFTETRDDA